MHKDAKVGFRFDAENHESWVRGKIWTDDPFEDKNNRMNETQSLHAIDRIKSFHEKFNIRWNGKE